MPHIRAIYFEDELVESILAKINNIKSIRAAVHVQFPRYQMDAIAFVPEPISRRPWSCNMMAACNLLALEFVIDLGKQSELIGESHSDALSERLVELCPDLNDINFGVWIREMSSNGFSEHKPFGV